MTTIDSLTTELVREPGSRRPASTIAIPNPSPELRTDVDPNIATRFAEFADACSRFSREITERSGTAATATTTEDHTRLNLTVARTVFSKWSIEILAVLYTRRGARFQEIKKALGPISSRVLSLKLSRLERLGLVRRSVIASRPPGVEYALTEKGLRVSKLGEPVVLFLRLTQGLLVPERP
jgi:DNA-binding HxlR family transcriptional regulator